MSTDEVRLLLAMARDPSYRPIFNLDPHTVATYLKSARADEVEDEGMLYDLDDHEGSLSAVYFYFDDLIAFLRETCVWQDGTPNMEKYQEWLPILSESKITICDLNAETWGRLLATATAEKLAQ
jgi:hypothetical protein